MLDESAFHNVPLCVVGSICRDVKTDPIPGGPHLLRDGETPSPRIYESLGGGGANTAVMAAALGAMVRFGGKIGDDDLGARLVTALRKANVKPIVRREPEVASGSSLVLNYADGQRHFISHQPNNNSLSLRDLDLSSLLQAGGHLLRADVWFAEPMLAAGNLELFRAAKSAGMSTSLDVNFDPLWNSAKPEVVETRIQAVRELLPLVDLVHGNERELNRFAGSSDLCDTLERLSDWGAGAVVLHLGERGAGLFQNGRLVIAPCERVERPVQLAGTGDLLSTCMMLLHHRSEIAAETKLRLANRIVSEFVAGCRRLIPEWE